jgi:threonine/homoserine/homoserine lactone efflux protein
MTFQTWTLYSAVVAFAIVVPGPAALLCVQHGLQHGSRRTSATILCGTLSALVLMIVSALGLWQLMAAAPLAFDAVRAGGAAWLMLLGVNAWRRVAKAAPPSASQQGQHGRASPAVLFRDGFLVGIGSPKDLLFFGALLPQFIDPRAPPMPQFALLFATRALIDGVVMSGYAALGQTLLGWLHCPARMRLFQRASGTCLMAAGAALAASRSVVTA